MGVPYELFWKLNPKKLESFEKAHDLKLKHDNESAWLNGFYGAMAIASCLSKKAKYPTKPIDFKNEQNEIDQEEKNKIDSLRFSAWAQVFNEKFKAKQKLE